MLSERTRRSPRGAATWTGSSSLGPIAPGVAPWGPAAWVPGPASACACRSGARAGQAALRPAAAERRSCRRSRGLLNAGGAARNRAMPRRTSQLLRSFESASKSDMNSSGANMAADLQIGSAGAKSDQDRVLGGWYALKLVVTIHTYCLCLSHEVYAEIIPAASHSHIHTHMYVCGIQFVSHGVQAAAATHEGVAAQVLRSAASDVLVKADSSALIGGGRSGVECSLGHSSASPLCGPVTHAVFV